MIPPAMGTRTLRRVMRRANVDASAALNPGLGSPMMSKERLKISAGLGK